MLKRAWQPFDFNLGNPFQSFKIHRCIETLPGMFGWQCIRLLLHLARLSKISRCRWSDQLIDAPLNWVLDGDIAYWQTGGVQDCVVSYPPTTPACRLGCCFSIGNSTTCTSRKDTVGFILGTRCVSGLVAVVFIRSRWHWVMTAGPLVFLAVWSPKSKRGWGNVVYWFWGRLWQRLSTCHLFWQLSIIRGNGLEVSATTWCISGQDKGWVHISREALIIRGGYVQERGHTSRFLVAICTCNFVPGLVINSLILWCLLAYE